MNTKSVLLALKGQWAAAAGMQANGFLIQRQLEGRHTLIGHLVAEAVAAITLSGLQNILSHSQPNSDVADIITTAVSSARNHDDVQGALKCEAVEYFGLLDENEKNMQTGSVTDPSKNIYIAEDRLFYIELIDASEARYLAALRAVYHIAGEPSAQRRIDIAQLGEKDVRIYRRIKNDSVAQFAPPEPVFVNVNLWKHEDSLVGNEEVTLAAAAILSEKAETGSFPSSIPGDFIDPYSNKPLMYANSDKGFVVYSVGPTGHYDGNLVDGKVPLFESAFRYRAPPQVPVPKDLLEN